METTLFALLEGARLRLDEGACLPLRSDFGQCRACANACPVKVLGVRAEGITLAAGCLDCGRCVAACPTDALHLEGFALPAVLPGERHPVEVECAKVPPSARAADAVEVPCLGALSAGRIAALHEAAGDRGIALVDRGWCGNCTACGVAETHPARAAFDRAILWLEAVSDPRPAPAWSTRPLPVESMPAAIPLRESPDPGPDMSRRQFFRTVARDPIGVRRTGSPMGSSGRAAFPAHRRREAPERRRLLDALTAAAERAGTSVPPEFFPRVTATGRCIDHRVCTAACPTGALKVAEQPGASSLTFSATACLACGACLRACPEGALALEPTGGERAPAVVAHHLQQTCTACGDVFTPGADETLCLACTKTQRFVGDAMAKFFSAKT